MTRWLGPALAVVILGIAVWALVRQLRGLDPQAVWAALGSLQPLALACAAVLVVVCFAAYGLMERLSSAHIGQSLSEPSGVPAADGDPALPPQVIPQPVPLTPLRALASALVAQGVSLSTGKGFFVAGAIRVRVLGRWGYSTAQALGITMLVTLHGNVGLTALLGVVCAIAAPWSWGWWVVAGTVAATGIWLATCAAAEPMSWRGWTVTPPRVPETVRGMAAGACEKLSCALLAWVLMPGDPGIPIGAFLAVMLVSLGFARFSQVPGGLGVLEASVLNLWPVPVAGREAGIIAGLLAFRIAYYLVPLVVSLPLLAFLGWWRKVPPCATASA